VATNTEEQVISKTVCFQNLLPLLENNFSSVQSFWKIKKETYLIEEIFEEDIWEYDMVVPFIPQKRYKIKVRIKNIIKALPIIVEPEEF